MEDLPQSVLTPIVAACAVPGFGSNLAMGILEGASLQDNAETGDIVSARLDLAFTGGDLQPPGTEAGWI